MAKTSAASNSRNSLSRGVFRGRSDCGSAPGSDKLSTIQLVMDTRGGPAHAARTRRAVMVSTSSKNPVALFFRGRMNTPLEDKRIIGNSLAKGK